MGPQDPKDVTRDIARDLSALVGELAALKGDATHWLTDSEYVTLRLRLENAHAGVEAALVEARRRVRINEGQEQRGITPGPLRKGLRRAHGGPGGGMFGDGR